MSSNPPPYEAHRQGDDRPLPQHWLRQYDANYKRNFWVDTSILQSNPPRSIWTHPLDDPEYQRTSGRTSPFPPPSEPPPENGSTGQQQPQQQQQQPPPQQDRMFGMSSGRPPQGGYAPQQGYYQQAPQQGYYPQGPPQGQYYPQQQYQQPPRKSGMGGMGVPLALGGGLLGGALLGDAFSNHEQYQQQQAYDQGYDNGYDQGNNDQGDYDDGGGFDGGDMGGGGF